MQPALRSFCAFVLVGALAAVAGASGASDRSFRGGFETGSYRPWIPQAGNFGYRDTAQSHFGRFAVTRRKVGQGRFGGRFDLPAWAGGRTRSQLMTERSVNVGGDDYYSLMFYVPSGWSPGTSAFWGVQIAELNYEGLGNGSPNLALQAHADHVTLALGTGTVSAAYPVYQYRSNADVASGQNLPPLYAIPRPMATGIWHELILHVHWATDATGMVEIWHRLKGQTAWTKTVSFSGYPTLQTNANGGTPTSTLDTIQAYRGVSTAPTTVWLDGFTRSGSFATAQSNLP